MDKRKKNIAIGAAILLLIIFYGSSFLVQLSQKNKEAKVPQKAEQVDSAIPFVLDTIYISGADWPPVVQKRAEEYKCTPTGDEYMQAGKTEKIFVDGKEYCQTKVTEGAAGSQYTQYTYLTEAPDGTALAATFSLRFVQCMNYDEPNQSACVKEQTSFEITPIIQSLFN
jgi:hypothetical protein